MMTEYYSGKANVSRFPSLWFLAALRSMPDNAERERLFHKYAQFIAADMDKKRPDILVSCNAQFDYVEYFSRDAEFNRVLAAFKPDGTVSVDYSAYYPEVPRDLLKKYECQIYRRGGGPAGR
jgi:hypothetical protein